MTAADAARRWRGPLAWLVAVVVVVAIVVWLRGDGEESINDGVGAESVEGSVVQQYDEPNRETPDGFSGVLLDGEPFDSDSLRGQVAVYNVWGSWCGPCRREAPALAQVAREFSEGAAFVGINVRDNDGAALAFEREFDVPYPSIRTNDSAAALLAFRGAIASAAVPSTVVLDADGRIAARAIGPVTYRTLRGLVEDAGARPDR